MGLPGIQACGASAATLLSRNKRGTVRVSGEEHMGQLFVRVGSVGTKFRNCTAYRWMGAVCYQCMMTTWECTHDNMYNGRKTNQTVAWRAAETYPWLPCPFRALQRHVHALSPSYPPALWHAFPRSAYGKHLVVLCCHGY